MKSKTLFIILSIYLISCGQTEIKNVFDKVTLKPNEHKNYSIDTTTEERIGIYLEKPITGGMVKLKQGPISSLGCGNHFASRSWYPENNKIKLTLVNESNSEVEIVLFKGHSPIRK